jgi:hyperosmotically inducible protein
MNKLSKFTQVLLAGFLALATATALAGPAKASNDKAQKHAGDLSWTEREVRHQLVLLPYYSVFDNLEFKVEGSKVILMGQVVRPTLKSDAENVVKKVEGVDTVVNNIEVLPLSPADDDIRRAEFRAIYSTPQLERYSLQAVPPIHIIVKNGHVTLEGVVASQADKDIANIKANGVPGVFSVTNNLRVEG